MPARALVERVRQLFAADKPAVAVSEGLLSQEIAVDRVLTTMMQAQDSDLTLSLVGIARHELRRLEADDEVFGALETRRTSCISTPWRIEPGTGQVTDFFYDELQRHGQSIFCGAWQALPYGYSVAECVYRQDGPLVRLAKVEEKPIEWFRVVPSGELRFIGPNGMQSAEGEPVDTDLKFLLTRHQPTYKQPYGESLLSRVYWPWFFRHNGWRFWGQFLERFGMPLLLGKVNNPKDFILLMKELGIDSVIAVDKTSDVQAVTVTGQGEFQAFEAVVCRRIQKAILGQTLTTDTAGSGSYALGKVHELVRQDRRLADIKLVSNTVQRWITALSALNFPGQQPPRFVMADGRGLSPERAKRDATLASAGVKFSKDYLLRAYDFEARDVEIPGARPARADKQRFHVAPSRLQMGAERVAPSSVTTAAGGGFILSEGLSVRLSGQPTSSRKRRRFTAQQEQIEALVANTVEGVSNPIDPDVIRRAVLAATDPEDLADRLAVLMLEADPKQFREALEQALFAAEVIGYVHAEQTPLPASEA